MPENVHMEERSVEVQVELREESQSYVTFADGAGQVQIKILRSYWEDIGSPTTAAIRLISKEVAGA